MEQCHRNLVSLLHPSALLPAVSVSLQVSHAWGSPAAPSCHPHSGKTEGLSPGGLRRSSQDAPPGPLGLMLIHEPVTVVRENSGLHLNHMAQHIEKPSTPEGDPDSIFRKWRNRCSMLKIKNGIAEQVVLKAASSFGPSDVALCNAKVAEGRIKPLTRSRGHQSPQTLSKSLHAK